MNPIYVSCHLCHAAVGEPCRGWARRGRAGFCDRRVTAAELSSGNAVDERHGLAHGALCTDHREGSLCRGVCTVCGQTISTLKAIPTILEQEAS